MKVFNVKESIKNQEEFCSRNKLPMFAPYDGWCDSCSRQIYAEQGQRYPTGISTEEAKSRLITSCPHCNSTFVD